MKMFIFAAAFLLSACQATQQSVNTAPGKYRDFADYMIATDSEITADAKAKGATPEQAHCVAEKVGREIHGSYYDILSAAVSGRSAISSADQKVAQQQQDQFARRVSADPSVGQRLIDNSWSACGV